VAFLLIAALGLASALPSTPGYVGIYQFVAVTVLPPFGLSRTDAIAYILVAQALAYVVIGFWGSIGLLQYRRDGRSGVQPPDEGRHTYRILILLFFLSGFCGLLYQIVWLRLAFASFGVITPVISVVISVFMLGLSLGSWLGGKSPPFLDRRGISPLYVYAGAEIAIGLSAFVVPKLFDLGRAYLSTFEEASSGLYLLTSAFLIFGAILPWCVAMGLTYPLAMAYMKTENLEPRSSFSFLYLANVIGAMAGAGVTAIVLIELLGFQKTLFVAAALNFVIAVITICLANRARISPATAAVEARARATPTPAMRGKTLVYGVLFFTGLTSMGMEVIWTRAFTPVLKTTIYAFALLLAVYLLATWVGSYVYREHLASGRAKGLEGLLSYLTVASLLPLLCNDPRFSPSPNLVVISIFPFCGLLGYLTPKLIDEYSGGDPERAGQTYAINVIGCITGPLLAGYVLLPAFGVKWSLLIVALPYLALLAFAPAGSSRHLQFVRLIALVGVVLGAFYIRTFEDPGLYAHAQVYRDHTATVIASGEGMNRRLLVNGIGITEMTPITKIMAHLPLGSLETPPQSALVICFGMGTTFRSLMSWGIETTAVELVPSVKKAFPFFYDDAEELLHNPRGHVVVDDGRRYLKRSRTQFDVITLDPPPPVEAAGSSLLYSSQLYQDAKKRLRTGGILQQWYPGGEEKILNAIARSVYKSFAHVKVFHSIEDRGYHFLASDQSITIPTAKQFLSRMPESAKKDLMEWFPSESAEQIVTRILGREIPLAQVLNPDQRIEITDDKPFNEYFQIRRSLDRARNTYRDAK
jgi:spermidine synthase